MKLLKTKTLKKDKKIFIIHADFKSIIVPEDNGMQNPKESDQISKTISIITCR